MKKKIKIPINKKERVVLSDILPYEIPVTFSNRHFYRFLFENNVELKKDTLYWNENKPIVRDIISLLFGLDQEKFVLKDSFVTVQLKNKDLRTIPFSFRISHNEDDFRELSIIHPKNQLEVVNFYDRFKQLILYYCDISQFSLRKPHKIARFTYFKDRSYLVNYDSEHEHKLLEEFDKEYDNLKSFFTYKSISNIHKFYESYKYHRCEKKYNRLFKFDISKCFPSIYSHSISWALLNTCIVKENLGNSKNSFGDTFDRLIQALNYGETNGIIVGPEFSRIFAEIILQSIDASVLKSLNATIPKIKYKKDYEIFRYVDDFFVFYNDDEVKDSILKTYRLKLKEYKLYVNNEKTQYFKKPIITGITKVKLKVSDLFNDKISFKETTEEEQKKYQFYFSSNQLITRFKIILDDAGVEYKDILNYTLACIDRILLNLIKTYKKIEDKEKYERKVTKIIIQLLDFIFFLYTVSPKVNTTIKLCTTLSKLIKFTKIKSNFNHDNKHLIFKKIYDDIFLVINKNKSTEYTQVETLYLLITLKELGKEYRIEESLLASYFGMDLKKRYCSTQLNHFSITVLLFYIENKVRYKTIKSTLKKHIYEQYQHTGKEHLAKYTELTILFFDLIACPFLDRPYKNKLFNLYNISDGRKRSAIISFQEYWFTKWTKFDFGKELDTKKSQEVY